MILKLKDVSPRLNPYYTIMMALVLLILPFSLSLSNIFIIGLLLLSISYLVVNRIQVFREFYLLDWLFILVFLLHVLSFLWTENTLRFSTILERNLSWLIFPLIFVAGKTFNFQLVNRALFERLIFIGFFIYAIFNELLILEAFLANTEHAKSVDLYFSRFYQLGNAIRIFEINYVYLSLYNCIAIIFGFGYLQGKLKWFYFSGIAFLLFYNFQLGSRTFFIINFILLIYFIIQIIKKSNNYIKFISAGIFVLALLYGKPMLVHSYSRFSSRITETLKDSDSMSDYNRLDRWRLCVEIINDNFWIGVGAADARDFLVAKYIENNLFNSAKERLNSHNQYLDYFIKFGIFGFLLLILILGVPIYSSYLQGDKTLLGIGLLFMTAFLTENYLSVQRGIVPFCLIFSLLSSFKNQNKNERFL